MNSFKHLWQRFTAQRKAIIKAATFSVLNKIFDIAPPLLIGLAVDTVVKGEESFIASLGVSDKTHQMYWLGVLTFLIWALESVFEFLLKITWRNVAQDVQHGLRQDTYSHLQSLHMSFFENESSGNLTTIVNDDINQLERFLDFGANEIIQLLTTVVTIGAVFFAISPEIAFLSFTPTPVILIGSFWFQKRIAPRYALVRQKAGRLGAFVNNNLQGMATIKSYVTEKFEQGRLLKASLDYSSANKSAIIVSSAFSPLIRMAVLCGFLFALVLGGIRVFDGEIPVGSYTVLIFLVQRLLWPLTRLGETVDQYQRAIASTERVLRVLDTPSEIDEGNKEFPKMSGPASISFQNVSFSYQTGPSILKNFDLDIPSGKTVALVGSTGSGKSTLAKLILRFYDTNEGQVLIAGIPIKALAQQSLRRHIALVAQDTYLFEGSVRDNILYGSFDKSEDDIIWAAKEAQAYEFICKLPQGLDTIVGERGQKLSGGQRQRISIARAILKNPSIFILDEATSAVDNETELAIKKSLAQITKGRTSLIIAHRLSTIRHADRIHTLEQGKIIESGTHEELLKKNGVYKRLWDSQIGEVS